MTAQPGGRLPAPEHLAPLQDLLNTTNLESGADDLSRDAFGAWSACRGVPGASEADRVRLLGLREHLRSWVERRTVSAPPALGAAVDAAQLVVTVVDGDLVVTSVTPLGRLIAPVVDGIRTAQRAGDWSRLKVCHKDTCRWAFYDHSRNNSSRWCSSAICGAREKSRRAYRRRTGDATVG